MPILPTSTVNGAAQGSEPVLATVSRTTTYGVSFPVTTSASRGRNASAVWESVNAPTRHSLSTMGR